MSEEKTNEIESTYKILQDKDGSNFARVYVNLDVTNSIDKHYVENSDEKGKFTLINMKIITAGHWNDLEYPAKAIEEGTHTFNGLQLRLNHSHDVKDVIGTINNVRYDPSINGARGNAKVYHADIEPRMLNMIRNGTITDVSAGLHVDVKEDKEGNPYAAALIGDHVGVVTRGACREAKMTEVFNSAIHELHTLESDKHNEVVKIAEEIEKLKEELAAEKKKTEEAESKLKDAEEEAKKSKEEKEKLESDKSEADKKVEEAEKVKAEEAKKAAEAKDNDGEGDGDESGDDNDDGDDESKKDNLQKKFDALKKQVEEMQNTGVRRSSPVSDLSKFKDFDLIIDSDGIREA